MAQKYLRLSIIEREIIYKYIAEKKSQEDIAKELKRHPSTISKEIHRDGMNRSTYTPSMAEKDAKSKNIMRKKKYKILKINDLSVFIEEKLLQHWSPEQISGFLKIRFPNYVSLHVSHETIYRYIYSIEDKNHRELLVNCLRQSRKRRRPRRGRKNKRSNIRDLVSIHDRPKEIENREEPGHWEGDLIIGKDHKSAIGTLVERTTRFTIIVAFNGNHNSKNVTLGFAAALGVLPYHMKKSLTYDRGSEMAAHKKFTYMTGIPVYFADAYSAWQRGTNENTNGLIRDYLPKKTDFRNVDDLSLLNIQSDLNSRPRKKLDFHFPEELFDWFVNNPNRNVKDYYARFFQLAI